MSRRRIRSLGVIAAITLLAYPLLGQSNDGIVLHGFGGWGYGLSSANNYLDGLPDGNYRHVSMALSLAAPVNDRLTIRAQGESVENEDGSAVGLDYAFADYQLTDHLSLRVGRVKHPFGIYTEVFTVGTLRPFLDLPQAVYGPVGFAGQAYNGAGLSGNAGLGAWGLSYDVYGGGYSLQEFSAPEAFFQGTPLNDAEKIQTKSTRDVIGTRLTVNTPVRGLSFGTSAYVGTRVEPDSRKRSVTSGNVDYRGNQLSVQVEIAHDDDVHDQHLLGGYVQIAYRFLPDWQVGYQYDDLRNSYLGVNTATAPSLTHHRENAAVLSYWVSRSLAVKAEYHYVNGNRLAMPDPESFVALLNSGRLNTVTHLMQIGAQFSF